MRLGQVEPAKVLTIGGSDSGGAAGVQADLKSFFALGVYGMSVLTTVTAQNSIRVAGIETLSPDFVGLQMRAVLTDYGADAVKTGFIGNVPLIEEIAAVLAEFGQSNVVVDPVLVNHLGVGMFSKDVAQACVDHLFPLSTLVTPNRHEAALITGVHVNEIDEMGIAARSIQALGPQYVLVTGGRSGNEAVDVLFDGHETFEFRTPWIDTGNTHGSGDTLSAGVAAYLARGLPMLEAVRRAHEFTSAAIRGAVNWRLGSGHGPLNHWRSEDSDW